MDTDVGEQNEPDLEHQVKGVNRRTLLAAMGSTAATIALGLVALSETPAFANGGWGGYSNGYIPLSAMVNVNYPGVNYWSWSSNPSDGAVGGVYMENAAAQALVAMLGAYNSEVGGYLAVNEGYRSFAGQEYWAANGSGGTPGMSFHGWGQAIDFDNLSRAQHAWLINNCGRFSYEKLGSGVYGEFDYIHFNYQGTAGGAPASEHGPELIEEEADVAYVVRNQNTGNIYTMAPQFIKHEPSTFGAEVARNVTTANDAYIALSQDQFNTFCDSLGIPRNVIPQNGAIWSRNEENRKLLELIKTKVGA
jgi:hypothetical protein